MVDEVGEEQGGGYAAITPGIKIDFPGERDGGGPKDEKEATAERPATAWAEVTQPQPR